MAEGGIAIQAGLGGSMVVIVLASIILNILAAVIYCKKKRLHNVASKYFLMNLAIIDIIAACLWSSLTALSIISLGWILPTEVCKVQVVFMFFCILINMHTFLVLAFERLILFHKPSKHEEIFINKVVVILIAGIWFFDGTISAFPIMFNWGVIAYFQNQYQCAMDYEKNSRQMNFMLVIAFVIPFLAIVVVNVFIIIRMKILQRRTTPGNAIILEKDHRPNGDNYASRLKKQNYRFQNAGTKTKKPTMEKKTEYTNSGYVSNSDTNSSDDEERKAEAVKIKDRKPTKKPFHLNRNDVTLTRTYLIVTGVYILLWLPYIIVSYITTFQFTSTVPDAVVTAVVIVSHCVSFVKPIIYVLHNPQLRKCLKGVLCRKNNKYKNFGGKAKLDQDKIPADDFPDPVVY